VWIIISISASGNLDLLNHLVQPTPSKKSKKDIVVVGDGDQELLGEVMNEYQDEEEMGVEIIALYP